jgi:hypothetical protein
MNEMSHSLIESGGALVANQKDTGNKFYRVVQIGREAISAMRFARNSINGSGGSVKKAGQFLTLPLHKKS